MERGGSDSRAERGISSETPRGGAIAGTDTVTTVALAAGDGADGASTEQPQAPDA